MYKLEDFRGINFFTKDELDKVDTDVLISLGYKLIESSTIFTKVLNKTYYYYHPEKPYVYVQCYFANIDSYTQLIISRDIVDNLKVIKRDSNIIRIESDCKKNAILFVRNKEYLVRAFLPKSVRNYISAYTGMNIIDSKSTVYYTDEMSKKGIIFPKSNQRDVSVSAKINKSGVSCFELRIIDKYNVHVVPRLRAQGFKVSTYQSDYFRIRKDFPSEYEAWVAYGEFQKEFYQTLRFNPFTDYLSDYFDLAYSVLILNERGLDDVIASALYAWRLDWRKIVELNLQHLYEEYSIPYIGVETNESGFMIPDNSNRDEVEKYKLFDSM